MQKKMTGNEYHATVVCVDSYRSGILQGYLHNPYLRGAKHFESLMEFLTGMDNLLNEMKFPQPFTAKREFAPLENAPINGQESGPPKGKLATFTVKVLFRQNASWQGSVTWLEDGREESFRSVLELLFLMNSALGTQIEASDNI